MLTKHCKHCRADTANNANKNNKIAVFDNLNLQKNYVERDRLRYPRDSVLVKFEQSDYIEQYKELKLFFKDYVGEELMTSFISYRDMKTKDSIEIIDLKHQLDQITPKKIELFHEYSADPENDRLFLISIRRRKIELISDRNKRIEFKAL